jgi:hypothetical protein
MPRALLQAWFRVKVAAMQRVRSFGVGSAWGRGCCLLALTLAWGLTSCQSKDDDTEGDDPSDGADANACYSCGVEQCPSQAEACDDLPACVTWRDCTLDCASTDVACRTECTTAASNNASAIVAGGNFVACATLACVDECVGSPSPSSPSSGSTTPPGGGGDLCEQLNDWAATCDLDVSGQIPDCSTLDATQECVANCIVDASCADYEAASTGVQNSATSCITSCVSGGGGPTPSTPTTSTPPTTGFFVAAGGYVTSGTWQGFAWTGTDSAASTIQPADYSAALGGGGLCATGTVAGTSDYSAVAMLGINLNQPNEDPTPAPATWTPPPSSLGIGFEINNFVGSDLRIQIQAPGGDTNANLRFCAEISNGAGTVAWSRFNTACWDGSGTSYNGTTPLEAIMVLVPGAMTETAFDFCLQSISPQ